MPRPALIPLRNLQPFGSSSSSHGEARLSDPRIKHRLLSRGDSAGSANDQARSGGNESESQESLESACAALEAAVATQRLDSDPFLRVKFPSKEAVLRRIAESTGLPMSEEFGEVVHFLPGEDTHRFSANVLRTAKLCICNAVIRSIQRGLQQH